MLEIMLGKEAIEKTRLLNTTQHNEAAHRSLSVACPKNITFKALFNGRVAGVALKWNEGPGLAVLKLRRHLGLKTSKGQFNFLQKKTKRQCESKEEVKISTGKDSTVPSRSLSQEVEA